MREHSDPLDIAFSCAHKLMLTSLCKIGNTRSARTGVREISSPHVSRATLPTHAASERKRPQPEEAGNNLPLATSRSHT